jgi:hypothetical protein
MGKADAFLRHLLAVGALDAVRVGVAATVGPCAPPAALLVPRAGLTLVSAPALDRTGRAPGRAAGGAPRQGRRQIKPP